MESTDNLLCRTASTGYRTVYGAVVPARISGLAGKKQSVFDWTGQSLLRTIRANCPVTVGSARKWIALPVMKVSRFE